jgi:hypothetical protein
MKMSQKYHNNPDMTKELLHENVFPTKAKIGMVFTSHSSHLPFMKYALEKFREIDDMYVIGAYDPRTTNPHHETLMYLPRPNMWHLAHAWVFRHSTWTGFPKRHGWIWLQMYASSILKRFENIEYIFTGNGDCVWDKPEGVYELIDLLGDNDFMSGQSWTRHTDNFDFIHTCTVMFKRDAYFHFMDYIYDKILNPNSKELDGLNQPETAGLNPESMINRWSRNNDIKWEHAPIQPYNKEGHDMYCEEGSESTWKNIIGFRNLGAEINYRCHHGMEPLDPKYFDLTLDPKLYFNDHVKNTLHKYYTTGDERYLRMWHDQSPWLPKKERRKRMKKTVEDY